MRVGSLFAGIGGFDLGLERAGFEIAWQVEIDPYCQRVLAKHWPHVRRYGDITTVDWAAVERVDLLCGGFPCQDISLAGKGAGLTGSRSGLWSEYVKAIETLKPRWVLIENVAALRARGLDQVLGALAALGYDAEWHCIPASAVGAPHRRDRVWIIAYAQSNGAQGRILQQRGTVAREDGEVQSMADALGESTEGRHNGVERRERSEGETYLHGRPGSGVTDGGWIPEPDVGRVAHGVPSRVDRLRGLGNAIVPQIAEWLGRQIMRVQA